MKQINIPSFLLYPNDPISKMIFEKDMKEIRNEDCGYRFMLYTEIAEITPDILKQTPPFEINEIHYYSKENSLSWYSICTMKDQSVAANSVRNWVEKADRLATMIGAMDQVLRIPKQFKNQAYKKVAMVDMDEWPDYNQLHSFDESHVYGHVFYLNNQIYKKFILVAKKNNSSWRVEINTPSDTEQIIPPDFIPAGQTFGSFYPI